jgi:hypothetical protein
MKKAIAGVPSVTQALPTKEGPFEQMKMALRNNLKGLKKEDDKDAIANGDSAPMTIGGAGSGMMGGSGTAPYLQSRRVRISKCDVE